MNEGKLSQDSQGEIEVLGNRTCFSSKCVYINFVNLLVVSLYLSEISLHLL